MRQKGKERHAASQALIELREAMRMTQSEFASKVLERTETSVARYETSHPPTGLVLLKLADIAFAQAQENKGSRSDKFHQLRTLFLKFHGMDSQRRLSGLRGADGKKIGLLSTSLHGRSENRLAAYFQTVLAALRSPNPKVRANALKGVDAMREVAMKLEQNRAIDEIRETFGAAMYEDGQ